MFVSAFVIEPLRETRNTILENTLTQIGLDEP